MSRYNSDDPKKPANDAMSMMLMMVFAFCGCYCISSGLGGILSFDPSGMSSGSLSCGFGGLFLLSVFYMLMNITGKKEEIEADEETE